VPLLNWDRSLSVHIRKFDEQNRRLFTLANDLHTAVSGGKGSLVIGRALKLFADTVRTNYLDEEKLMLAHNYPSFNMQKLQHDRFLRQLDLIQKMYQNSTTGLSVETMDTIKDWLLEHIQYVDEPMGQFLNRKGIK
jgi:hemerythrin